jgi:hypothetical protein
MMNSLHTYLYECRHLENTAYFLEHLSGPRRTILSKKPLRRGVYDFRSSSGAALAILQQRLVECLHELAERRHGDRS